MTRFVLALMVTLTVIGVTNSQPPQDSMPEPPPLDPPPSTDVEGPSLEAPPVETPITPPTQPSVVFVEPEEVCPCPYELFDEPRLPPDHWAVIEFVQQWWRPAPLGVPFNQGPVGQPRPRMPINLNGSPLNTESRGGFNLLFGTWLNPEKTYGIEAGMSYNAANSDYLFVGGQMLVESPLVPLLISQIETPEGQRRRIGYLPETTIGFQETQTQVKLFTTQANLVTLVSRGTNHQLEALGGFRYLHLGESISVNQVVTPSVRLPGEPSVFGASDRLSVRTDFYGGQVGLRGVVRGERLYVETTGKLAVGGIQDIVRLRQITTPGITDALPDVDRSSVCGDFAMLPELSVRFGFVGENGAHWFVGYDFLYLTEALRVSDFVGINDRGGRQEFWAHGLMLGVQWTY